MYVVQALIPDMDTLPSQGLARDEWTDIHTVAQEHDEITELSVARERAALAERFYVGVRIVKTLPGGARKVVR